jgi:membrane-associated PAP2 superfamily phosphatase
MRASTAALVLIVLAASLMALVSVLMPGLDIAIARYFFDPQTQQFPVASIASLHWLREQGPVIVTTTIACLIGTLVRKFIYPRRPLLIPGRAMLFLALTLAIGPGLVVNVALKNHWGRPRPVQVTQFGGHDRYVPWWDDHGTCPHNCSFVSGEASMAAWLFAPAVLLPPPWRALALGGAAVFTAIIGFLRMAYGGHFFTDTVFGALLTLLVIWLVHGFIYRWPRTRLDERIIDKRLEDFASARRRR